MLTDVDYAPDPYACVRAPTPSSSSPSGTPSARSTSAGCKRLLAEPVIVDLRNIYRPEDMARHGFSYVSVGRPRVDAAG